jgi:hypothetical protein
MVRGPSSRIPITIDPSSYPAFSEYDQVVHPHREDDACVFIDIDTVIRVESVKADFREESQKILIP